MSPPHFELWKALQLTVSVGVLMLLWLIFPGVLAAAVGLCYVVAAVAAMGNRLVGIWLAFTLTVLAFAFSTWGVYRYLDNGFDYLTGNFANRAGIYWPAYLFLFVALGSLSTIALQALSWRRGV